MSRKSRAKPHNPFRYFHSSPELIRDVVMLYIRYPLSLRNVEDLLFEQGYNTRDMNDGERAAAILKGAEGRRLTYRRIDRLAA